MSLPVREAPTYTVELPLTKEVVKFRPFLVKEQKNMMIAGQGDDETSTFDAIVEMVKSVCENKIDIDKIPLADLEYLFLQIRSKSVGEKSRMEIGCVEKDCGTVIPIEINLAEASVDVDDLPDREIKLNDEMLVEVKFPTAKLATKLQNMDNEEASRKMLRDCMVRLHDKEKTYEFFEYRDAEIDEFIDNLTIAEFDKLSKFFLELPQIELVTEYKCPGCGVEDKIVTRGLQSFF
jgi:hypothetical protein